MSNQHYESTARSQVDLFTPEEHRLLAYYFGEQPSGLAADCTVDEALERIGIAAEPETSLYGDVDAAVAFILLEGVEDQLPSWGYFDGEQVHVTRSYRPKHLVPHRKVAIVPQHLFTLNWADSGPGFSWPGAYYCTWVPGYDHYVVTYSGDTSEIFGFCDLAIGAFGRERSVKEGSREVVTGDWEAQSAEFSLSRWARLFSSGLVSDEEAAAWADDVWPEGGER